MFLPHVPPHIILPRKRLRTPRHRAIEHSLISIATVFCLDVSFKVSFKAKRLLRAAVVRAFGSFLVDSKGVLTVKVLLACGHGSKNFCRCTLDHIVFGRSLYTNRKKMWQAPVMVRIFGVGREVDREWRRPFLVKTSLGEHTHIVVELRQTYLAA
jgi:hypothetical protein